MVDVGEKERRDRDMEQERYMEEGGKERMCECDMGGKTRKRGGVTQAVFECVRGREREMKRMGRERVRGRRGEQVGRGRCMRERENR
jgi:hypothetical protein